MGPKKGQKVTITGEEYCEILGDILHEYYNRIISDDEVFLEFGLDRKNSSKFAIELSIILGVMALRLFGLKHSNDGLKAFTRMHILTRVEDTIFDFNGKEKDNYEDLFDQRYNMFVSLIAEQKTSYDVRSSFLGFARFLVAQFSTKEEDDNKEVIQKTSAHIVEYGEIISRFISKSRIKTSSALSGKYEFVVTM